MSDPILGYCIFSIQCEDSGTRHVDSVQTHSRDLANTRVRRRTGTAAAAATVVTLLPLPPSAARQAELCLHPRGAALW